MTAADKEIRADCNGLLPCPFCGPGTTVNIVMQHEPIGGGWLYEIICQGCSVTMPCDDSEADAISDWNTRATLPLTDPLSSGHGVGSDLSEKLWELFYAAFWASMNEHSGTEPTSAAYAGFKAVIAALQTSPPALQGSEEVLGNAALADPISEAHRISSEGMTCYARDEVLCDNQWCLYVGCLIENKRWAAAEAPRVALAAAIHKARWPADRTLAATPFEDEDRNGREYCLRIADAVAEFLRNSAAAPVASDEANKLVFPNPPSNSGSAG